MYRRRFLAVSAPAVLVGGAGCSSLRDESPGVAIGVLELENLSSRDVVFDVAIANGAEATVFDTEQPVASGSAVALERPVDKPGQYTIGIATDGKSLDQDVSSFAEAGESCVTAIGRFDQAERLRIEGNGYGDCSG